MTPWRLFFDLLRPYRWPLTVGFVLLILTNVLTMVIPRLVGGAIDRIDGGVAVVALWVGGIVLTAAVRFFVRIGSRFLSLETSRKVSHDLRRRLVAKFLRLPMGFFLRHSSGDLISRAINDVGLVRGMSGFGLMFGLSSSLSILLAFAFMMVLNWQLALLVLLPLPPTALVVSLLATRIKIYTLRGQKSLGEVTEQIREDVSGIQVVKGFNLEDFEEARFADHCEQYLQDSLGQARMRALMQPLMMLTGGISALIVLYYGGLRVISGAMSLGDFTAFNLYLGFLLFPTVAIGWTLSLKQRAEAALVRLAAILTAEETIRDAEDARSVRLTGGFRVDDLRIGYPVGPDAEDPPAALDGVTIEAGPGECVALVGKVGSGKTTLIKCLLRLLEVPRGRISFEAEVEGKTARVDLLDVPLAELRHSLAYVPQDDFLFSTSVQRNIALGKDPGRRGDREDVREAARRAAVHEAIEAFPQGYRTRVGERGLTVSGGQRQRIGLARALVREAPLLLLDDCLSAIDAETAEQILSGLVAGAGRATSVIAAHRLASIRHADRIYVLEDGRVREVGDHASLLEAGGLYAQMWEQQQLALEMEAG